MAISSETNSTTRSVKIRDVKIKANRLKNKVKIAGEKWTLNEKNSLYKALCKYGDTDVNKIAQSIRNRSVNDVRGKLNHYKTVASAELHELISKSDGKYTQIEILDNWIWKIRHLNKTPRPGRTVSIALVFKMLELFGNHPKPKDCFGINFKDVYGWLYDCYCGNPIRKFDIPTTAFILKVCNHITNTVYGKDVDVSSIFLPSAVGTKKPELKKTYPGKRNTKNSNNNKENINNKENSNDKDKPPIKTYSKKKEQTNKQKPSEDLLIFKQLLKEPDMNPLDIPYYHLKVK